MSALRRLRTSVPSTGEGRFPHPREGLPGLSALLSAISIAAKIVAGVGTGTEGQDGGRRRAEGGVRP